MPSETSSTANTTWQGALNPQLTSRLMRPLSPPGSAQAPLAATILSRLQRMGTRLPLLTDVTQRQATGEPRSSGQLPIVYAQPAQWVNRTPETASETTTETPVQRKVDPLGTPVATAASPVKSTQATPLIVARPPTTTLPLPVVTAVAINNPGASEARPPAIVQATSAQTRDVNNVPAVKNVPVVRASAAKSVLTTPSGAPTIQRVRLATSTPPNGTPPNGTPQAALHLPERPVDSSKTQGQTLQTPLVSPSTIARAPLGQFILSEAPVFPSPAGAANGSPPLIVQRKAATQQDTLPPLYPNPRPQPAGVMPGTVANKLTGTTAPLIQRVGESTVSPEGSSGYAPLPRDNIQGSNAQDGSEQGEYSMAARLAAPIEPRREPAVDDLVDKVLRKLMGRLTVESERRGWVRWP